MGRGDGQHYKLCGFLNAVASVVNYPGGIENGNGKLIGSRCWLDGEGSQVYMRTESGITLVPIGSEEEGNEDSCAEQTEAKKRRVGSSSSVMHQLQALRMQKCLEVEAVVVAIGSRGEEFRAVVLVDVYLPSSLWTVRNFWKPGMAATALLSHLGCNWESRSKSLAATRNHQASSLGDDQSMWNPGECHVLGCKMHYKLSESAKRIKFDLHALFKTLPSLDNGTKCYSAGIKPAKPSIGSGIWDIPDEVLTSIFSRLLPKDLLRVAATCQRIRSLTLPIMPCMNLTLFPHQQAAVQWMLQRERSTQVITHPLFLDLQTEDGFHFYLNEISGELSPEVPPTVMDFRGGMFCDEPGLGKTVTALSLILKTQGTLADPPEGVQVKWCDHSSGQRYGYYEISASNCSIGYKLSTWKRCMTFKGQCSQGYLGSFSPEESAEGSPYSSVYTPASKMSRLMPSQPHSGSNISNNMLTGFPSLNLPRSLKSVHFTRCTRSSNQVKRNLLEEYEKQTSGNNVYHVDDSSSEGQCKRKRQPHRSHGVVTSGSTVNRRSKLQRSSASLRNNNRRTKSGADESFDLNELWVQCDACSKWRKLPEEAGPPVDDLAWFCSMNKDPLHQSCSVPEEDWDSTGCITYLPGFFKEGTIPGQEQNISFFTSVLKEHTSLLNLETKQALTWLANLSLDELSKMETTGVALPPGLRMVSVSGHDSHEYYWIFKSFGLVQRKEGNEVTRWYYPRGLDKLVFDLVALRIALTRPVDVIRLCLSRATLIVVPANLVGHWKDQILKHTRPGQLRVFIWIDQEKPPLAHNLAWDYDIVITTFPRLSAEWSLRESSVLMRVHWLRVMLDEGHTLGSSLSLTNKLQMAISLTASCRWLLTGTPTPNTPNSQVAHLHPMLKFLHEEVYGKHQKSWEAGILRPFESGREEGRIRLLKLLQRCMISARKADLQTIPPCIKKVQLLDFTEKHAGSYNELVVTVRRNILMADWNDPSHVESLLNPKQWKFRSNTIRNVRLSCCVAGHIKVRNAGEDIQETMDILVQQGVDPLSEEFFTVRNALLHGGNCYRCQEWCRLPIITPCRHLLCLDCVALDCEKCTLPGCGNAYKMQSPEDLTRPENPNPKWPVPQDLIELQPSYVQDDWNPDWHATSSSKVSYLVERLKTLQDANREMGLCFDIESDPKDTEGAQSSNHRSLNPTFQYVDDEDRKLPENMRRKLPEKAIVFSQFLEHINVVERQLTGAGIKYAGMYSPMHSCNKTKSLVTFQNDPNCMVLLMDGSAALGLDLSFVTHVFLMEPIWDRSMEEQVISRAHRMGATRPILVETLAMRGTIEEQMLEFLQDPVEHRRALKQHLHTSSQEGQKCQRTLHDFAESSYLARLTFVRTKSGS